MVFKHFYDDDLAQGSFLVGCRDTGKAVVVDARRDVGVYLQEAERQQLRITDVTETHIHADYLSGSRELAAVTGAELHLSGEGDADWQYGFPGRRLKHDDTITLGSVTLRALHTPGHTPEHLSFLVEREDSDELALLTGDFVFVGDLGRPDLLDEAAGGHDTRFEAARQMFRSLKEQFLALPDSVGVWPGHGAGSACGKAIGTAPSTTVGQERQFAWWAPYLRQDDEQGFVDELLTDQPDAPAYFGRMKRQNRDGPALLGDRPDLREFTSEELQNRVNHDLLLIDTRLPDAYNTDTVSGALSIPAGMRFSTFTSYALDPEREELPLVLLASDQAHAQHLRDRLAYVGVDNVAGFTTSLTGLPRDPAPVVTQAELADFGQSTLLDVRAKSELAGGYIPGARQLHVGRVLWRLDELPQDEPIIVYCQTGIRATVAASAMRAAGLDARELIGSYSGWQLWRMQNHNFS